MVATATTATNGAVQNNQRLGFVRVSPNDPRLYLDNDYQRGNEVTTQRKILKAGWSDAKAGAILLNLRPSGVLSIVDGGNRLRAAQVQSIKAIQAHVIQISVEEEAQLYVSINRDRKSNNGVQLWKAMLNYDPAVKRMNQILRTHGFRVASGAKNVNDLSCTSALHWIFQRGGDRGFKLLDITIRIIKSVWPDTREARTTAVLQGVAHFITFWAEVCEDSVQGDIRDNAFDIDKLIRALANLSVPNLLAASKERCKSINYWASYYAVSFGIAEAYNRSKRLPKRMHLDLARYHGLGGEA